MYEHSMHSSKNVTDVNVEEVVTATKKENTDQFWADEIEESVQKELADKFITDLQTYDDKITYDRSAENLLKVFMQKAYSTEMESYIADAGIWIFYRSFGDLWFLGVFPLHI